jgi:hypothetical protein
VFTARDTIQTPRNCKSAMFSLQANCLVPRCKHFLIIHDFKLPLRCERCILFWVIPLSKFYRRFGTLCLCHLQRSFSFCLQTHEDGTECSETSAQKIQRPGNHPKEIIQHILIMLANKGSRQGGD